MTIEMSFIVGPLNDALPIAKDRIRYGFLEDYLRAELQVASMCDRELRWIENYEKDASSQASEVIFGNLVQRRLEGKTIVIMYAFPFDEDPTNYGEPLVIPLADVKDVIQQWRDFLKKFHRQK